MSKEVHLESNEAITILESFWLAPAGRLFMLRDGEYEPGLGDDLVALLDSIRLDSDLLPRRLVSLTWLLPRFLEWQVPRVLERQGDIESLKQDVDKVQNALDRLLGLP